ncbi:MAG: MBL fold metallo-hydrolase [Gammaproteobacteria bacterium]|jgi:glyoxylase-like metal-dependent hydrolase (beta-lactamase superfamily II)|nr:MBL fold metallo-hydrolase [Gammaproteobacteria bacterium]
MLIRFVIYSVIIIAMAACDKAPVEQAPNIKSNSREESNDIWRDAPYEPTWVDMRLIKVGEHTYYAQGTPGSATEHDGFISNAGVVITNDGVVLFDALGTPSLGYLLLSKIRELTDQPVRRVIASHYHADHIYGLQVFKDHADEQGVEVWAPKGAKEYLGSEAAKNRLKERQESLFPWVDDNTRIVPPDVYIEKQQQFSLGGVQFSIEPLGSTHSQGDMMLRVDSDGVLFSGDLIFQGRIPFVAGNTTVWLEQLHQLDVDKINVIVPGHGQALTDVVQAVSFTTRYLQYLHDQMGAAVDELIPFADAYANTDWSRYEKMPAFVANRPNAYHVYLRLEQQSLQ